MPSRLRFACLAALILAAPAASLAQFEDAAATPEAEVHRLVRDLDADDPVTRENATESLATDPGISLRTLERFLADTTLSREQRRRLLSAAFERFRPPSPRAALGVSFEPSIRESGVRINHVVPAFPAAGLLRAGDRVMSFDGVPIRDQQHAIAIIVSHDPGDALEVSLVRDGDPLNVTVPLGRRDLLDQPTPVSGPVLVEAWAFRCRAYASEEQAPIIEPGVGPAAWVEAVPTVNPEPLVVVAGGEARGGFEPGFGGDAAARLGLDATIIRPQIIVPGRPQAVEQLMIQRRLRLDRRASLMQEAAILRTYLDRKDVDDVARAQVLEGLTRLESQIRDQERAIRQIDAQLSGPPR